MLPSVDIPGKPHLFEGKWRVSGSEGENKYVQRGLGGEGVV